MAQNRVVLASNNEGKLAEAAALAPFLSFVLLSDFSPMPHTPEPHASLRANALDKALAAAKHTNLPALADDSGLFIPAFGGIPGVLSALWSGVHGDSKAATSVLLGQLSEVPASALRAYFECCLCLALPDGSAVFSSGVSWGRISKEPQGSAGFGYDPIFVPDGYSVTFAQMSPQEKAGVSHRARAYKGLAAPATALLSDQGELPVPPQGFATAGQRSNSK